MKRVHCLDVTIKHTLYSQDVQSRTTPPNCPAPASETTHAPVERCSLYLENLGN